MNSEAYTSQIDELAMALAHSEARIAELETAINEHREGFDPEDVTEEDRHLYRVLETT